MAHVTPERVLDVDCAGCGQPTPYDAGESPEHPSYGERLSTPLGTTYVRTHRRRECVLAARERLEGRKIAPPKPKALDT